MRVLASPYADLLARIPVLQRTADVDGRPAEFWEYGRPGDSPTLLLVHGFRGDHHGLEPVVAHLPGVHVIAPDLPGFGLSPPLTGEHSIAGYAAWLQRFAEAAGVGADAVAVGHSFGTIVVAAALADGMPAASAILVNPIATAALAGPNALGTRLAAAYYGLGAALPERLGSALLKNRAVTRGAGAFLAKTRDRELRAWIHDQHDRYFSGYANRRVVLEAFRASVEHDVSEYADRIRVPVHLVAAERDDITALVDVQALATRVGATIDVIPSVGHLVHYETPRAAAESIGRAAGVAAG